MTRALAGPALLLAGFVLLTAVVMLGLTGVLDLHLLLAMRGSDEASLPVIAAEHLTKLGSASIRAPVGLVGAGCLLAARARRPALALTLAWSGESLLVEALKAVIARPRPDVALHLADIADASFPSAHAAGAMALYPLLGLLLGMLLSRRAGQAGAAAGVALALLVGLTRLVLGVHWPSDVLAGWLLGGVVAWFAAAALKRDGAE